MPYFLDTNTCIYALKGRFPAISGRIASLSPSQIKIPSMVKAELLFGARKSQRPTNTLEIIRRFLAPFEVVGFDTSAAEPYGVIRAALEKKGQPIGPNDLVIAATTVAAGGILVTHNTREFRRVPKLELEDWTKPPRRG